MRYVYIVTLGEKIKSARKMADLTLTDLSDRADVDQATISRIERGLVKPEWETMVKIAKALGISLSLLEDTRN